MAQKVIFPNDGGGISVLTPILDSGLTVEQIALKDVPAGKPFLIVDDTAFPEDDEYREAWEADFSEPHGIGMGHDAWTALNDQ